jgi:hypothetical protein
MKKIFIFIIFVFIVFYLSAQEWSEPINISNTPGLDENPSFCIDNNGVLHCVWTYKIEPNYRKIYYSKSEDDGESWDEPQDISQNDEMWMGLPHIVSDSQNNLYVAYLYNVGNSHIYFMKFDGSSWSEPYSISGNYLGVGMSDVVIDNNDRVYVFWHWGGSTGEIYYRYLENDEWSEIICPYGNNNDHYCFAEGVSDNTNNLHCIIDHHPENVGSRTSYIKYDYASDTWEDAIILATRWCQQGMDIDLDSNEYPHLVWREYVNDSIPPNDGTLYSYFDGENFTEPEILVEDPWWQVIAIDNNDIIHLVEKEKYDTGSGIVKNLVYYTNIDSIWEGTIIVESENVASLPKLEIFNNKLYLIYFNSNEPFESDIYFMKKDLSINSIEGHYISNIYSINLSQNYPNPFNPETQINFSLNEGGSTTLRILNIKGQLVKTLINSYKNPGNYSVTWDGTDNNNKPVSSGVYYYRLQVGNRVKTKSLILVK